MRFLAGMYLWLLCCLLLFGTAQGYDWLNHQAWFVVPDLSLPWILLGGLGLAIASNRSTFRAHFNLFDKSTVPSPLTPTTVKPASNTEITDCALPTNPVEPDALPIRKHSSISFEIAKRKGRSRSQGSY